LITGATSGIGRAAALALGVFGWELILVGRNRRRGERIARHLGPRCRFIETDISDLDAVRRLSDRVQVHWRSLDVLINNAGARFDRYQESAQGIELTFATNHLGHFLLTNLLRDLLLQSNQARVITVSSSSHFAAENPLESLSGRTFYERRTAYACSKLANLLFAFELADRMKPGAATSNAVDPGGVASRFASNNGWSSWLRHLVAHLLHGGLASPGEGARTVVYLAASEKLTGVSGQYFRHLKTTEPSAASRNSALACTLWAQSQELTRDWLGDNNGFGGWSTT